MGAGGDLEEAVTEAVFAPGDRRLASGTVAAVDDASAKTLADVEPATSPAGPRPALALATGDEVGRFLVEETIGQGGMGVVLAAHDRDLDRRVALKLLRPRAWGERDRRQAQSRLLREAQAMARLSHPNVVAVHEVGTVGDRVFIAMEYVEGCTIREWCSAAARSWREVIALFDQAGQGLAAAHAAGLVHRDFNPGNVLVGNDQRAQVTDFGLVSTAAAAVTGRGERETVGGDLEETPPSTSLTRTGAVLGTPLYMAPEQHRRQPVDARADQYSFCAALYEALYGELPFAADSYPELCSRVCAGDAPALPVDAEVPAWVGAVVLRGLERDPGDRYPSMEGLLAELRRDPDAARGRRRRWLAVAGALLVLSAVAILGLMRSGARATPCTGVGERLSGVWDAERRGAVAAAFRASERAYAGELLGRVEGQLDDYSAAWVAERIAVCRATRVDEVQSETELDLRMACLDRCLAKMYALTSLFAASVDQEVLDRAADAVASLPRLEACADLAALTAAVAPPEDVETRARVDQLRKRIDEAEARERAGKYESGLALARAALADARALDYQPVEAEALHILAALYSSSGKAVEAETALRQAIRVAALAKDDKLHARAWIDLVYVIGYHQARHKEALALRETAEAAITRAGDDPRLHARLFTYVAEVLRQVGDYEQARGLFEKGLAIRERELEADHVLVAQSLNNLGTVLVDLGQLDDALSTYQRAHAIKVARQGPNHPNSAISYNNLGMVLELQGNFVEAEGYYRRALAVWEQTLEPGHPRLATALNNLGGNLLARGERGQARVHFEQALEIWEKALGPDHPKIAYPLGGLGSALYEDGKYVEARPYFERALAIWEKGLGPEHPHLIFPLLYLGKCLVGLDDRAAAIAVLERGLAIYAANPTQPNVGAEIGFNLARLLGRRDRGRALELAVRARATFREGGAEMDKLRSEADAWLQQRGVE